MTLSTSEQRMKELITDVLVEMMQERREEFYAIVLEALEDVGLANAIAEGRKDEFVSEESVFEILEG